MQKKRKTTSVKTKSHTSHDVEKVLVQNFVSLQKVMTNLSLKFDNLAVQISKLLDLFEISAKNLAKKDFSTEKEDRVTKEISSKLDNLLNQNKIIARGLTLMHESNSMRRPHEALKNNTPPGMETTPGMPKQLKQSSQGMNEYHKSISSNNMDHGPRE